MTKRIEPESQPSAAERITLMEWILAGIGLLLMVGLIGYHLWRGLFQTM